MDKKYMLETLKYTIPEMEAKYRSLFSTDGSSKSIKGAAVNRSKRKRLLDLAKLIEYLLMYCPDNMEISNADLCHVFDRLTEPRRINIGENNEN